MVYFDTSALAKLYLTEPQGAGVDSVVSLYRPWIYTSVVTYAELLSTLARARREGRIDPTAYRTQKTRFLSDWSALYVIDVTPALLLPADRLIPRHAEFFNLTNTPQFNNPTTNIGSANAGRIRSAASALTLQRIPRHIQFGLKFYF